jgi:hypothetical protein
MIRGDLRHRAQVNLAIFSFGARAQGTTVHATSRISAIGYSGQVVHTHKSSQPTQDRGHNPMSTRHTQEPDQLLHRQLRLAKQGSEHLRSLAQSGQNRDLAPPCGGLALETRRKRE